MLKIENTVADIKLQGQTPAKRFINKDGSVKQDGIILEKPFKLQITVVAKVNGKKRKRVRSVEYNTTLKKAIIDATAKRIEWAKDLKKEIITDTPTASQAVITMLTLSEAWDLYREAQIIKYESDKKTPYDSYRYEKLYNKHIRPVLGGTNLDDIDPTDIKKITNAMRVTKAKEPKEQIGFYENRKPKYVMETRPASLRTKRSIYQLISPIYNFVNKSNKIKFTVNNPAVMDDLPKLDNEKVVELPIEVFTKLYRYDDPRYRNIFIWLMHGRRFGEVVSLRYEDIDFDAGTYTIKAENNKARVDMTYVLTKWQRDTLTPDDSGLCFPSINSKAKQMNSSTVQQHFSLSCTMHDLRHILGGALVNSGTPIEVVGRILGHKPPKKIVTFRYAKVTPQTANAALCGVLEKVLV